MADAVLPVAEGEGPGRGGDVDDEDQQHRVGLPEAQRLLGIHRGQRDDDRDARLVGRAAGEKP